MSAPELVYTVAVRNVLLGTWRNVGRFVGDAGLEEAKAFARREAEHSRGFVGFEVWTMHADGKQLGKRVELVREGVKP